MSLNEEVELLRNIPLFSKIEPSKLKLLAFTSERLTFHKDQNLCVQGEMGDAAFIIIDGAADVIVSTDSQHIAEISRYYGAQVPFLRPAELAGDHSPDIEWVRDALGRLRDTGREYDCFSILRPTSPFRKPATIRRAWNEFLDADGIDSLRAVELCGQHPGKMWVLEGDRITPLLKGGPSNPPWHSMQYQSLPKVYVQNASLEIAWTRIVMESDTIAGSVLLPFLTERDEGFDVNTPKDWWHAEHLLARDEATVPAVAVAPWTGEPPSTSGRG